MEIDKDKLKNFLNSVKDKINITAQELIEKDFYLNILLSKLNFEEYVFKGGTCLAKAYLDTYDNNLLRKIGKSKEILVEPIRREVKDLMNERK